MIEKLLELKFGDTLLFPRSPAIIQSRVLTLFEFDLGLTEDHIERV